VDVPDGRIINEKVSSVMDAELRTFFPINSRQGNFIVLTPAFRSTSKGRYRPWMVTVFDTVLQKVRVVRAVAVVPDLAG
jgi:hypothetical protein